MEDRWFDEELSGCRLGDGRLDIRLRQLVEQMGAGFGESIPLACQDWANTKAAYRFFSNDRVSEEDILRGHFDATRRRFAASDGPILILHDTTEFSWRRRRPEAVGFTTKVSSGKDKSGRDRMHTVCEQRGRAVPLVVMRHRARASRLHRQPGLGAVERLDLALLVNRQDNGVRRWIDIKADDVPQLGNELRVTRQLELPDPVGLKPVRPPDALYRADADADRLGHRRRRPMCRLVARRTQRQRDDAVSDFPAERRNGARVASCPAATPRHPRA